MDTSVFHFKRFDCATARHTVTDRERVAQRLYWHAAAHFIHAQAHICLFFISLYLIKITSSFFVCVCVRLDTKFLRLEILVWLPLENECFALSFYILQRDPHEHTECFAFNLYSALSKAIRWLSLNLLLLLLFYCLLRERVNELVRLYVYVLSRPSTMACFSRFFFLFSSPCYCCTFLSFYHRQNRALFDTLFCLLYHDAGC